MSTTFRPDSESLPDMTLPESFKSSSFQSMSSLHSDDTNTLDAIGHFEDIGLDDDADSAPQYPPKPQGHQGRSLASTARSSNPYRSYSSERYPPAHAHPHATPGRSNPLSTPPSRDLAGGGGGGRRKPEPTPAFHPPRPTPQSLHTESRSAAFGARSSSLNARSPRPVSPHHRGLASRSTTSLSLANPNRRHRSRSPVMNMHMHPSSLVPRDPNTHMKPRRSSWQSTRERKTSLELEKECDDDDDDDDHIPEGIILDNVPISPRPQVERSLSRASSRAPSVDRGPKERVRSIGNGTPRVALAHGSLKSPTWKTDPPASPIGLGLIGQGPQQDDRETSPAWAPASAPAPAPAPAPAFVPAPLKARAKSWNAALSELSTEAKALTEKLEEHADQVGDADDWTSSYGYGYGSGRKPDQRVKSALPDLPSLRQANIMIDAMPMSKEKEAVLARTRPSWLPPKDPAEDRKHWKEYEKMVARSIESDRRREAEKLSRSSDRDVTADGLMRIWEENIIPRWPDAVRERRTRELWWRGVASRSRGVVWSRAIGNELDLTPASYKAALNRAYDVEGRIEAGKADADDLRKGAWFSKIREDVKENTWQDLRIFQVGGPLHQSLLDLLFAYAMYRSDIGYVQGCNTVAALLLLNLPNTAAAFIALANVLNRSLTLGFYAADLGVKASAYNLVLQNLKIKSPGLHDHLTRHLADADPDVYLASVFTGLGTLHLAMDECARLWDVYVFEGDRILVRAATALLLRQEMALLGSKDGQEIKLIVEGGVTKNGRVALASGNHDEGTWMKWLREAGKADS
ncbi:hypothetical protein SODALDRAFT_360740 [Sodiomyces alkalinus F11]|uniref:Rab-GAP TBC domain-containing protein n=1 Tax=Sodiomyces alkalinus (strain CBS 110278 / VKM F-3762 / F11) TaxID=1314773 RepID=A0A3N2PRE3_SODAK|nr:hypothetical protein SODALDRAFT_360740 [Sodiomyces alkalinus F11]ROT37067.1 hypothetical protein SODALDRAFT_360740 [Sodiomyces alkalinus F11]